MGVDQIRTHADLLGALTREQEDDVIHHPRPLGGIH
jgi:hypothetical protein